MSNKGGGCLCINNKLTVVPKPELPFIRPGIETIFVDIYFDCEIKTVGMVYRRASEISIDNFSVELNEIFSNIDIAHHKVYIMGDFNVNLLQYHRSIPVADYCNNFISHGLYPLITKPTRTTAGSATLIDNIFTNDINCITRAAVIISDVSDHYPIFVQKLNSREYRNPTIITYRKYSDHNIQNFKEALNTCDFNDIISTANSNDAFTRFHSVLIELFEVHFPLITKELRHKQAKNPWMTPGLLVSQKEKDRLYRRFKRHPITHKEEYNQYRNAFTKLTTVARENYIQNQFETSQGNSKKVWKIISNLLGKNNQSNSDSLIIDDEVITDPLTISNAFNEYFNSIPSTLSESIISNNIPYEQYLDNPIPEQPIFNPVDQNEVKYMINGLKNSNSTGWDNIPTNVIKAISGSIVAPLTQLINKSLQEGIFPDALKIAKISPIYKNKCKTDIKNYRPISVLPVISKIFEKVFYSRLYAHFVSNNLLSQNQYGFQALRNTEHALLKFTGDVMDGFDSGNVTVATFMDLSKAFDCVNHEILIGKLQHYGVSSVDKSWVKSYLHDRKHLVSWNKQSSSVSTLNIGVPQGSILGPLLFLIYINDIVNSSDGLSFVLFADDTTVYSTGKNLNDTIANMNNQLINISNWFTSNKLTLNVDKTQVMIFSRRKIPIPNTQVELKGQPVVYVAKTKFLGVIVNRRLNWKDQISSVAGK